MTDPSTSVSSSGQALGEEPPDDRAQRKASIITVLGLVLMFASAFALWLWSRADESNAIREIPARQRAVLYESTRQALDAACHPAQRPAGLEEYCDAQAHFILLFEECDAACQELSREAARQPRR